jgi:hypothetical protein
MADKSEADVSLRGSTESRIRAILLTYVPMFIAVLALLTSIYNGYLNGKFVDLAQRNVGRIEYMRSCKEIIEAYFQAKVRLGALNAGGERGGTMRAEQMDAANAVAKFAALGTYLANLRDETIRYRYTQVSLALEKLAADANRIPASELGRRLETTDREFNEMNNDCVRSAKEMPF